MFDGIKIDGDFQYSALFTNNSVIAYVRLKVKDAIVDTHSVVCTVCPGLRVSSC